MLTWNQLHQNLEKAANRHRQLATRFENFANHVAEQVAAQPFHIKGISVSLHLEQGFFTTTFATRTLHFVFTSVQEDGGTLVGNVKCYLKRELPKSEYVAIGDFNFTGSGQTTLIEPEENVPITIDSDLPALYVALHFIHESLSR